MKQSESLTTGTGIADKIWKTQILKSFWKFPTAYPLWEEACPFLQEDAKNSPQC